MIAIDFGTSRVKVAYFHNGEAKLAPIGRGNLPFIPSLFYLGSDREILVGDEAEDMLSQDPKGVIDTLKRKLRESRIRKNRQRVTPEELLTLLFETIKDRCFEELPHVFEEEPKEVILTYPAKYTEIEQNIIKKSAYNAGFEDVDLITEPEAAAFAWQHKGGSSLNSDVVVILDCGGGTADWACLKKQSNGSLRLFTELPEGGDKSLGGHDVDVELLKLVEDKLEDNDDDDGLDYLKEHTQDILFKLKTMKEKFSTKRGTMNQRMRTLRLGGSKIEITEDELLEVIQSRILSNMVIRFSGYLQQVRQETQEPNPVVLLVGGTGKLRGLKETIADQCGVEVKWWMESEFATVQGALYTSSSVIEQENNIQAQEDAKPIVAQLEQLIAKCQSYSSLGFIASFLSNANIVQKKEESSVEWLERLKRIQEQSVSVEIQLHGIIKLREEEQNQKTLSEIHSLKEEFNQTLSTIVREQSNSSYLQGFVQSFDYAQLERNGDESLSVLKERISSLNKRATLTLTEYHRLKEREEVQKRKVQLDSHLKSIDIIVHKMQNARLSSSQEEEKKNIMLGIQRHSVEPTNEYNLSLLAKDLEKLKELWGRVQQYQDSPESLVRQRLKEHVPKFKIIKEVTRKHGFSLERATGFVTQIEKGKYPSQKVQNNISSGTTGSLEDTVLQRLKNGHPKFKIIRSLVKDHGYSLGEAGMFVSKIEKRY